MADSKITMQRLARANPPAILQVLPRLVTGGVERGTVDIAAAIAATDWTAVVASEGGPMVADLERMGVRHESLPLASKNPLTMLGNVDRLARVIKTYGVSLIHARSRACAWSALWAARRCRLPLVTTFHGTYGLWPPVVKRHYNKVMVKGERVIAVSEFVRHHILQHYSCAADSIRVIHRGVDLTQFNPANVNVDKTRGLLEKWRAREGEPVIVLPGRLTRWKGHLLLIEALSRLADLSFLCVFVGSARDGSPYPREVEAAAIKAGLAERTVFAGEIKEMPAAYRAADVVVSASTVPEAFGRVVAEGCAMGRLTIAPAHGAAPEVMGDDDHWMFAPNDAASLAQTLRRALTMNVEDRAVVGTRARERTCQLFPAQKMGNKTLAVYRELLFGA